MDPKDLKNLLDVLDIPIKWAALVVGAIWTYKLFVKKRSSSQGHPATSRAVLALSQAARLVRVTVVAQNKGEVLLNLKSCRVLDPAGPPLPPNLAELLEETGEVASGGKREADWPLVAEKEVTWPQGFCEIEPGESQSLDFDLVLISPLRRSLSMHT